MGKCCLKNLVKLISNDKFLLALHYSVCGVWTWFGCVARDVQVLDLNLWDGCIQIGVRAYRLQPVCHNLLLVDKLKSKQCVCLPVSWRHRMSYVSFRLQQQPDLWWGKPNISKRWILFHCVTYHYKQSRGWDTYLLINIKTYVPKSERR